MNAETQPVLRDAPIGIDAAGVRHETESIGHIDVPADRYLGAQTQRSLVHFSIGDDCMQKRVYHAHDYVKKAAALVNAAAGRLPQWKAEAIARAADEAIAGDPNDAINMGQSSNDTSPTAMHIAAILELEEHLRW
jgi:fumarate hydratase class II